MITLSLLGWLYDVTLKGSVVIALVALAVSLFGTRLSARWRHALWLIVLIRLAVPVSLPATWSVFNYLPSTNLPMERASGLALHIRPGGEIVASPSGAMALEPTWWERHGRAVLTIWVAGFAVVLLRLAFASRRLNREVARAEASRDGEASARLAAVVAESRSVVGLQREVAVIVAETVRTPALHGIVRPKLLLPEVVARSFGHREVRHIVLHELWHLRRNDVAVNWFLSLIQAVHWFNPLVWYAVARIREEREMCCDELALSCLEEDERSGYGSTILRLLEEFRTAAPVPALVGIVNQKQLMKRRLSMIASFPSRKRSAVLFVGVMSLVSAVAFTDATGGETKRVMRKMHPGTHHELSKTHQRISLNLTAASFNDLISGVSAATGVVITPSAEVATNNVQNARFTVAASNVPGHLVLVEALAPFGLAPVPTESGISIEPGTAHALFPHRVESDGDSETKRFVHIIKKEKESDAIVDGEVKTEKHVVKISGDAAGNEDVVIFRHHKEEDAAADGEKKRIVVRSADAPHSTLDENGELHREMKVKLNISGEETEGTFKLDITTR